MSTSTTTSEEPGAVASESSGIVGTDITTEQDGGVIKEVKREGRGEASPLSGDKVFVHYVGTLLNGEKFDSSRDRKELFEFTLGKGNPLARIDLLPTIS